MIGVLGASGAIGQQVCRLLLEWQCVPLRIGSRHCPPTDIQGSSADVEHRQVDIDDPDSLAQFMDGCALVLNCAGPSRRLTPVVLKAAQATGVAYIDAGGAACAALPLRPDRHSLVLLDAGAIPGLSGLLPCWLAQSFSHVTQLRVWHGIVDHFTPTGAEDFLAGVPSGEVRALPPAQSLPFFPRPVIVEPYRNAETEAVGKTLGLASHQQYWSSASEEGALLRARGQVHGLPMSDAVHVLCQAADMDCLSYRPYVRYLIELTGMQNGQSVTQTALVTGSSVAAVSGSLMAALAMTVRHALDDIDPLNGTHAAQFPASSALIAALFSPATGVSCQQMDGPMDGFMETQGGAL